VLERVVPGLVAPGDVPVPRERGATLIEAQRVGVAFGDTIVLDRVDLVARAGELVALIGPNGAGKSTLLAALTGDLPPTAGMVFVDGQPIGAWTPRDLARRRAVLPQQVVMTFPFEVGDVVRMGRTPWAGTEVADEDDAAVDAAMAEADVAELVGRRFPTLSGGEKARVALARVLAQRAQLLLLDEPTAALDLHHQEHVLTVVRGRIAAGHGAVVVLHDLGLAVAYADRVVVLSAGRVVADGPPAEVCTADLLSEVYRHPLEVLPHPRTGSPLVLPHR
jgi:iron complex transport system ATP-binding protein